MTLLTLDDQLYIKALIYGDSGSGKTTLATSALLDPRSGPILYLDCSGNPQSGLVHGIPFHVIKLSQLKDLNTPFRWLQLGQPAGSNFAKQFEIENHAENNPFRTIIIDQMTDLQVLGGLDIKKELALLPGDIPKKSDWDVYDKLLQWSQTFTRGFFQLLPLHVLVLAQEEYRSEKEMFWPQMNGKGRNVVPGQASAVWRLRQASELQKATVKALGGDDDTFNVLFTEQLGSFLAKTQYPSKPEGGYIVDPTMTKILDQLNL